MMKGDIKLQPEPGSGERVCPTARLIEMVPADLHELLFTPLAIFYEDDISLFF
jgi:hypothetical protein